MGIVWLTALGVGGATVAGAIFGFCFRKIPLRLNDAMTAFAAGVMLTAALFGLVAPALEGAGILQELTVAAGIGLGALALSATDGVLPHLHGFFGKSHCSLEEKENLNHVLLFVLAMGIHNLPEGIAAGVSFGTGSTANALSVALGIAIQNIPEGMVIIPPMLGAGIPPGRAFFIALCTGLAEVFGTLIGYFAIEIASVLLPFILAFAGGTMIYVICHEMIPQTHAHGYEKTATYLFTAGVCIMLLFQCFLS